MRWIGRSVLVWACLIVSGCTHSSPSVESSGDAAPRQVGSEGSATDLTTTPEISLEIKSWEAVQQWVASQHGKVVVIDVWSTSCHPCLREFPHFVELHQQYGDRLACASLSIDFYGGEGNTPQDVQPRVLEFLTRQRATMDNFLASDPDEVVLNQIGAAVIPVSLVYDREGQLHTAFNNDSDAYGPEGFNYKEHIGPLVETLLR